MNDTEFKIKRAYFHQTFPQFINEKNNLRMRVALFLVGIIGIVIIMRSLPAFDISCVEDNVFFLF